MQLITRQPNQENEFSEKFLLTDKIAEGLLNTPRSKLRDPVILATGSGRPAAEVNITFLGEACVTRHEH